MERLKLLVVPLLATSSHALELHGMQDDQRLAESASVGSLLDLISISTRSNNPQVVGMHTPAPNAEYLSVAAAAIARLSVYRSCSYGARRLVCRSARMPLS